MLVGCALRRRSPETTGRHIAVFIHEDYRRQGHGTELVKMLSTNKKTKYVYLNGIEGSSAFFKAQNMVHMYDDDPEDFKEDDLGSTVAVSNSPWKVIS